MKLGLPGLDALRGVLALYVLAGHARWLLWEGHATWLQRPHSWVADALERILSGFRFGHEAVMVFFVLSGFFIHLRCASDVVAGKVPQFHTGDYLVRRVRRIVPPFFLALCLTLCADAMGRVIFPALYRGQTGDELIDRTFQRGGYGLPSVAPALLCLPASFGRDFGSNGPLWSIAYEVVYYAAYPLWLGLRTRLGMVAYLLPVMVAGGIVFSRVPGFIGSVFAHYPIWLAGAFLAEKSVRKSLKKSLLIPAMLVIPLALLVFALSPASKAYLPVAGLFGLSCVLAFGCFSPQLLCSKFVRLFRWLGVRSYTIYVCHFPLLALASAGLFSVYGHRPGHGWFALGAAGLAIGITVLLFSACERRFLNTQGRMPS